MDARRAALVSNMACASTTKTILVSFGGDDSGYKLYVTESLRNAGRGVGAENLLTVTKPMRLLLFAKKNAEERITKNGA